MGNRYSISVSTMAGHTDVNFIQYRSDNNSSSCNSNSLAPKA